MNTTVSNAKIQLLNFPQESQRTDYPQDTSIVAISFKFGRAAYPVMICKPLNDDKRQLTPRNL